MSIGAIIAITVGGSVLFLGGIGWLVVWIIRSNAADEKAALERLTVETARRRWTFVERDDDYVALYNARNQYARPNPLHPFVRPPIAVGAQDVITGSHRGRPFLAAVFDARHRGERVSAQVIWVRTPALRPALSVTKTFAVETKVNAALGWVSLTGSPEFDRRFSVSAENEQFARDVLNPGLIEFLLTDARQFKGFSLVGEQFDVRDPVTDHRDPAELVPALDLRCDILDLIPPAVWA